MKTLPEGRKKFALLLSKVLVLFQNGQSFFWKKDVYKSWSSKSSVHRVLQVYESGVHLSCKLQHSLVYTQSGFKLVSYGAGSGKSMVAWSSVCAEHLCIYPASQVLCSPQSCQAGLAVLCAAALLSLSAAKLLLIPELAEAGRLWLCQQKLLL